MHEIVLLLELPGTAVDHSRTTGKEEAVSSTTTQVTIIGTIQVSIGVVRRCTSRAGMLAV